MDNLVNKGSPFPTRHTLLQLEGGKRDTGILYSGDEHSNVFWNKGQIREKNICIGEIVRAHLAEITRTREMVDTTS